MKRLVFVLLLLSSAIPFAPAGVASAADPPEVAALANLRWRSIGPANMGGRVTDIVGLPGNAEVFYVGAADGGIFKTTNGGVTFRALFQEQAVLSIGAMAIAPSDTDVIWVGTGEGDPRNSASFGNGVYRSTDGGDTWKHLGLEDTERIKRIRVHPTDPDTAWVAALGHAWGANEERGIFKTTDGGKTWKKTLYLDADTGCSDLDIDAQNPRILYAGMYTFRRKAWHFTSGGKQTALYQSRDGGDTWTKLTNGLPRTPMDRIGVAVSRSNPSTVYMISETKTEGNLFRSDDRGASWRRVYDNPNINFRPFYYSDIRVDPNDPERIYSLSGSLSVSSDGGRTFANIANNVHGDHQALWIDPANSNRVLSGSDGGYQISYDKGRTFEIINNVIISQFYHITYDMRRPYYVYGGLQDNGNWGGPSATMYREGIRKDDWFTVSGGDGFFVVPEIDEPNIIYSVSQGGSISVIDTNTGVSRNINPYPKDVGSTGGAIADYQYRFNWNPPIVRSPHHPKTIYFGGNVVFKTTNRGRSWETISPDLTTNDKSKQQSSGGEIVTDNTAAEFHCTILTIAESPVKAGVIWVGTDDGNIQVTQDGGKSWKNVVANIKGLPANSYVPMIDASPHEAGTAFVAVDRHRDDDFSPHAFKTTDYGQTWTAIKGDLPKKGYVHVVREDPKVKNLLYAGTELGIYASWDGGNRWVSIRNNVPPAAVNDLAIHPRDNDLILGTHGRGVWILDNITPLQQLAQAMHSADAMLFDIRPSMRFQVWGKDSNLGSKVYAAQNPPYGAMIDFFLKADVREPLTITVADKTGKVIRTIRSANNRAGVNRVIWDLRYDGARPAPGAGPGGGGGGGGRGGGTGGGGGGGRGGAGAAAATPESGEQAPRFGGFGAGPSVLPGDYTVTLRVGGKPLSKVVKVELDPRVKISDEDLLAQLNTALEAQELVSRLNLVVARVEDLTQQLTQLGESLRRNAMISGGENAAGGNGGAQADIKAALDELTKLRSSLVRECNQGYRCPGKLRENANSLMNSISGSIWPPTEGEKLRLREATAETDAAVAALNAIINGPVKKVNDKLSSSPHVVAAPVK